MYDILSNGSRKLCLPDIKSSCCTENYLQKVFFNKVFSFPKTSVNENIILTINATIDDLMVEIVKEINLQNKLPIGITTDKPANKAWLVKVLSVLNPDHEFFKKIEDEKDRFEFTEE